MSLSRHEIKLLSLLRDRTWVLAGGRMVKTTARLIDKGLLETRGRGTRHNRERPLREAGTGQDQPTGTGGAGKT